MSQAQSIQTQSIQTKSTMVSGRIDSLNTLPSKPQPLSTLVYSSRAVSPVSGPELHRLAQLAQLRNRNEGITGVVVYDDQHFFQWLEGPAESLARIMESIRGDPRHTDIRILSDRVATNRQFSGWDMKLATRRSRSALWSRDVLEPPRAIVQGLHRDPYAVPVLLLKLVSPSGAPINPAVGAVTRMAVSAKTATRTAALLGSVVRNTVIPALVGAHVPPPIESRSWPAHPRALELARLLVAPDPAAALALIREIAGRAGPVPPISAELLEPAARGLGNLWSDDFCTELDVTLGLGRLLSAARLLRVDAVPRPAFRGTAPTVLIAPEPGELHLLGAALDSDVLWDAGWATRCEYPSNDKTLQEMVAATWFDALDLSLSAVFRRDHWLGRVSDTIARARRASRNPALVVVVGGRVFTEQKDAGAFVGADGASTTSARVEQSILDSLRRGPTAANEGMRRTG